MRRQDLIKGKGTLLFVVVLAALGAILFKYSQKEIVVHFPNSLLQQDEFSCAEVFPIKRKVFGLGDTRKIALKTLLAGPTAEEIEAGYYTSINQGTSLESLKIQSGVATADFSRELSNGVAGSCRVTSIRSQIERTLDEFAEVRDVVISVELETEGVLEP